MRAGAIVGRALSEFGRTAGWTLPLAALAFGLSWVLDEAIGVVHLRRTHVDFVVVPATWLAGWVVELAAAASVALARVRGERPSVVGAIRAASRRVVPLAAACALSAAAVLAGLAALLLPGLVALGALGLAVPIAVDERCGPWRALARSAEVSRGCRGQVALALGALSLAAGLLGIGVALACAGIARALDVEVGAFGAVIGVTWVAALPAVGAAVAYHAVRSAREAPRTPELERVFG